MKNLIEVFPLTTEQVTNKEVTLTYTPKIVSIKVAVAGQPFWVYGIDYTVSTNYVNWTITDNVVHEGNTLIVNYEIDEDEPPNNVSKKYIKRLTSNDLINKYIDLPEVPLDTDNITVAISQGGVQLENTDYKIQNIGQRIYWGGLPLEPKLNTNHTINIEYSVNPSNNAELKRKEQFIIDFQTLSSKKINLSNVLNRQLATDFILNTGGIITQDLDYELIENSISWNNLGLDGKLKSGDVIEIIYHSYDNGLPEDFKIYKINEDLDITSLIKEYASNSEYIDEAENLWKVIEISQDEVGKILYERIQNLVQNTKDIDVCNLHSLYSLSKEMGQDNLFSYDLSYPVELEKLMNIFSINPSIVPVTGKVLNNETLNDIWNSSLVSKHLTMPISGFVESIDMNYYLEQDLINEDYTTEDFRQELTNVDTIYKDDWIYFIDSTLENHLKEKLGNGKLNIDQKYIDNPEYYETDNEVKLKIYEYEMAQEYLAFVDNIFDCPTCYNSTTSGDIIRKVSKTLRNICLKAYYNRENLKNVAQKYNMVGAHQAISKILEESYRRIFSKYDDWNLYVGQPSDFIYDDCNYTKTLSSDIFLNTFLPSLKSLSSMSIDVNEYYDKTEYLNISAATPYKTGLLGYETSTVVSTYINSNGLLLSSEVETEVPIYGPDSDLGPEKIGGNVRYWEYPNSELINLTTEHTSGEVLQFYRNIGLPENEYPTLSSIMDYQNLLYDTFAVSGYIRNGVIPDLTAQKSVEYQNYQMQDVPSGSIINEPVDLTPVDSKYSGLPSGDIPWVNHKNDIYPTVAFQPMIWNLIEKVYKKYPTILETLVTQQFTLNERKVDDNGNLIDSWKYDAQEFNAYQTLYECSINQDYSLTENKLVDREGPFNGENPLRTYLQLNSLTNDAINSAMYDFYKHISSYIHFTESIPSEDIFKLKFFRDDIFNLSGNSIHDHDEISEYITKLKYSSLHTQGDYQEVTKGKVIFNYDTDLYDNHHTLYKTSYNLYDTGRIWTRIRNYPLPFPMAFGYIENITSLNNAYNYLLDNEFIIKTDPSQSAEDLVNTTEYSGTSDLSGDYLFYDISRKSDGNRIAQWYANNTTYTANIYSNVLKITDPNVQQINIGNSIFENLDYTVNNCYDFHNIGSDMIVIGKDYSLSGTIDRIYIFSLDQEDFIYSGGEGDCLNKTDYDVIKKIFVVSKEDDKYPSSYTITNGIRSYAGFYSTDKYYVFVFVNSINETNGEAELEFMFFDFKERIWKQEP